MRALQSASSARDANSWRRREIRPTGMLGGVLATQGRLDEAERFNSPELRNSNTRRYRHPHQLTDGDCRIYCSSARRFGGGTLFGRVQRFAERTDSPSLRGECRATARSRSQRERPVEIPSALPPRLSASAERPRVQFSPGRRPGSAVCACVISWILVVSSKI